MAAATIRPQSHWGTAPDPRRPRFMSRQPANRVGPSCCCAIAGPCESLTGSLRAIWRHNSQPPGFESLGANLVSAAGAQLGAYLTLAAKRLKQGDSARPLRDFTLGLSPAAMGEAKICATGRVLVGCLAPESLAELADSKAKRPADCRSLAGPGAQLASLASVWSPADERCAIDGAIQARRAKLGADNRLLARGAGSAATCDSRLATQPGARIEPPRIASDPSDLFAGLARAAAKRLPVDSRPKRDKRRPSH